MSDFSPINDPRAIKQRVGFTSLTVEWVDELPPSVPARIEVGLSGVEDIQHVKDIFYVVWNDPDGVTVTEYDGDSGQAVVQLTELG